jgi:RimJ/RimL family protein N-acetyltransferase
MLEHAFERLGCLRVEFKTDARNERSRAALAALPAPFEGIFRKHMLVRGGERRDSAYYSIIDDEWPEVRDNLARRIDATRIEETR